MKYIKSSIFFIILLFSINLIITILSYFDIFNNDIISIIKIISYLIIFIITGIYIGLKSKRKAYIEGLKLSLIIISIFFIISIIFTRINIKSILSYLIIISLIVLGSIIGINIKRLKH